MELWRFGSSHYGWNALDSRYGIDNLFVNRGVHEGWIMEEDALAFGSGMNP